MTSQPLLRTPIMFSFVSKVSLKSSGSLANAISSFTKSIRSESSGFSSWCFLRILSYSCCLLHFLEGLIPNCRVHVVCQESSTADVT